MRKRIINHQSGFTIVELIIAMAIFSFILVIMASGVARLIQFYTSTLDVRATQEAARNFSDAFTEAGRQSQLITTQSYTDGTGNQNEDSVCYFTKILSHNTDGTITGNGIVFHMFKSGPDQWQVVETQFLSHTSALNGCYRPAASSPKVTDKAVSIVRFQAVASTDNRLVQLNMSIAGGDAVDPTADINYSPTVTPPAIPYPVCLEANRFCPITDLQMAVEAREPQS